MLMSLVTFTTWTLKIYIHLIAKYMTSLWRQMPSLVFAYGRHLVPSSCWDRSNALLQLPDLLCSSKCSAFLIHVLHPPVSTLPLWHSVTSFILITLYLAGQLHPNKGLSGGGGPQDGGHVHHQRLPLHLLGQGEDPALHCAKDLPWGGLETSIIRLVLPFCRPWCTWQADDTSRLARISEQQFSIKWIKTLPPFLKKILLWTIFVYFILCFY